MKKIILTALITSSVFLFAKVEEPKLKETYHSEGKVLVAKKNFKEEKVEKKIELKTTAANVFEQSVFDRSLTLWTIHYLTITPIDMDFIGAVATAQCMADLGLFP